MAFSTSYRPARSITRRAWPDVARVGIGVVSLAGALGVALLLDVRQAILVGLVSLGLVAFAAMMLLVGRAITRRWLAFGAELGFAPGARRPLFGLGADRPVLHGRAGGRPARLCLVRARRDPRAWLQVDTELLTSAPPPQLAARASALAHLALPGTRVSVHGRRLVLRAPFSEQAAIGLVGAVAEVADALEG
ncbi:MAG TPA: hypothetical protein VM370_04200 [Candidatus Thermoplasmatota archaeon]|nr:hypothetical protein [Candidatus Thermoplasmatota archaeon]